jgi:heme-degrading monooxygenase HmoA
MMVLEVANIRIDPAKSQEFEAAIENGVRNVLAKAKGFLNFKIQRGVENPEKYLLMIEWASLEDHMVGFRESPAFAEWRGIVGSFFAAPVEMEHFELIAGN